MWSVRNLENFNLHKDAQTNVSLALALGLTRTHIRTCVHTLTRKTSLLCCHVFW